MTREPSGTESKPNEAQRPKLSFPRSARILRSSDFRRVYDEGRRVSGPLFAAFYLRGDLSVGPRIGFTVPRSVGRANVRNRLKRRIREAVRRQFGIAGRGWNIVFNPRRAALDVPFEEIEKEVKRLLSRCGE